MEARFPKADGLATLEKIKTALPQVKVVLFSGYDSPTYIARATALGASDYVLKSSSPEMLLNAVTRAAADQPAGTESLLEIMRTNMNRRREAADESLPVTNREVQVLRHIALGLSNREIGKSLTISVETVKEHVQNLLRKLEAADRTQAAVMAVKRGLV